MRNDSMTKHLLIIRADADGLIGSGHVMRSLALAQEWRKQGGEVVFFGRVTAESLAERIQAAGCRFQPLPVTHPVSADADMEAMIAWAGREKAEPDWLVLDGYHFDPASHDAIRAIGWSLLVVDDYAHLPGYHADILLNPNAYAGDLPYTTNAETLRLLGVRYLPLRQEFRQDRAEKHAVVAQGRRILITMGGADPDNAGGLVLAALAAMDRSDLEVKIVVGPLNPHGPSLQEQLAGLSFQGEVLSPVTTMAPLMRWADLAVSAAGSTCWELAALGVPMLVTVLADNQERVAASLEEHGVALNLGWFHGWQPEQVAAMTGDLLADHDKRQQMSQRGRQLVDGRGCERLTQIMHLFHFSLRPAAGEDCRLVYQWANDPQVRAVSFHSEAISWEEHCRWFHEYLAAADHVFLIAVAVDGQPLGQARFVVDGDEAIISVSIARQFRGLALGVPLVRRACRQVMAEKNIIAVRALIKKENQQSIKMFSAAGFKRMAMDPSGNQLAVVMEYRKESAR